MLKLDKNARLHGEPVRYVAMGDSFTEGVGDVDTDRPNQVRGWEIALRKLSAQSMLRRSTLTWRSAGF